MPETQRRWQCAAAGSRQQVRCSCCQGERGETGKDGEEGRVLSVDGGKQVQNLSPQTDGHTHTHTRTKSLPTEALGTARALGTGALGTGGRGTEALLLRRARYSHSKSCGAQAIGTDAALDTDAKSKQVTVTYARHRLGAHRPCMLCRMQGLLCRMHLPPPPPKAFCPLRISCTLTHPLSKR